MYNLNEMLGKGQEVRRQELSLIEEDIVAKVYVKEQEITLDFLKRNPGNYFLVGNSGAGKTCFLLHLWDKLIGEGLEGSGILPIYVKAVDLDNRGGSLIRYINWYYCGRRAINDAEVETERGNFIQEVQQSGYKVLLMVDAIDELQDESLRNILWGELKDFVNVSSFCVLLTSQIEMRGDHVPGGLVTASIMSLSEEISINYMKKKHIVLSKKAKMGDLFLNPMFLTMFVQSNLGRGNFKKEELEQYTESTVFQKFFETKLRGHKRNERTEVKFVVKTLLPMMCYLTLEKRVSWEKVEGFRSIMEDALEMCLSDRCLLEYDEIERRTLKDHEEDKWFDEFTGIIVAIDLFRRGDQLYKWRHSLFCDWFTCQGAISAIRWGIAKEKEIFDLLAEKIDPRKKLSETYGALKSCEYFYANYENEEYTKEYLVFLVSLAYLYDDLRKEKEVLMLSPKVLKELEKSTDITGMFDKVELAGYINGVAYSLVHLRNSDTDTRIKYNALAKEYLDMAFQMVESDESSNGRLVKAKIFGNLGAHYLTVHELSLDMAREKHEAGLKLREQLLKEEEEKETPDLNPKGLAESLARSYTCLGTDCFYGGNYGEAVDQHREAIIKGGEGAKNSVSGHNRVAGAMICDILMHPVSSGFDEADVVKELGVVLKGIEKHKMYGEMKPWEENFFRAIQIAASLFGERFDRYKDKLSELVEEYEGIVSYVYLDTGVCAEELKKQMEAIERRREQRDGSVKIGVSGHE